MDWCKAPDQGLPQPDLVLFIDLPAEVAQARAGYGEERYEKVEFQRAVRKNFDLLLETGTWRVVDGNQGVAALSQTIEGVLAEALLQQPPGSLKHLDWA